MTTPNPYAPPATVVRDVPDLTAPIELADPGIRLAAFLVDSFIMGAMCYLPIVLAVAIGGGFSGNEPPSEIVLAGVVVGAIGFIAWCWLTIRFVLANGQSIAKRMLGIKVVRSDGSRASLGRIFWLRNVVNGLLAIIPVYQLVDWLFIFGEPRQCLHDKLADTIVIKA